MNSTDMRTAQVELTCAGCGRVFLEYPSQRKSKHPCCSTACANKAKTGVPLPLRSNVWKTCPTCGSSFKVGGKGEKSHQTKYCSHACSVRFRYASGLLCNPLTERQASYIAGFADGEGCVGLFPSYRSSIFLRFSITNTYRAVLEWCVEATGIGHVGVFTRGGERTKPQWVWTCSSLPAESVLRQLQPYAIVKRRQIDLALEFMEKRDALVEARDIATQQEYRLRMAALNKRGPTP